MSNLIRDQIKHTIETLTELGTKTLPSWEPNPDLDEDSNLVEL
jgi:hypothetical protein